MRTIGVVGAGHVGLVTAACFAKLGNKVLCADNDGKKIAGLKKSKMPFYEPGLEPLVRDTVRKKKLIFTTSLKDLAREAEIIFIAVGTPPTSEGRADLTYVEQVTVEIAKALNHAPGKYRLIVEKSTVPVLTGEWVRRTLELLAPTGVEFDIAANPEFLREGNAVKDFLEPDRVVVGVESARAEKLFREIYAPVKAPIVFTDIKSAELIKHASNSFLALKISYINAVSQICERVGADVVKVAEGMGHDARIGKSFLNAGAGYGGSCFPKDVSAFAAMAEDAGYPFVLLKEVERINKEQRALVVKKARELLWNLKEKTIAVLGLAFKPDTDDIRDAPAIDVIRMLTGEGAKIRCHDPQAAGNMKRIFPDITYCRAAYGAIEGAHLLVLLTEWPEYKHLDFKRIKKIMKTPYVVDGRNFFDADTLHKLGFVYRGIGRNIGMGK